MTEEAANGITIPLEKIQERVAKSISTLLRAVQRIKSEIKKIVAGELLTCSEEKSKEDLDDEAMATRIVHNFYVTEKHFPCVSDLRKKICI